MMVVVMVLVLYKIVYLLMFEQRTYYSSWYAME